MRKLWLNLEKFGLRSWRWLMRKDSKVAENIRTLAVALVVVMFIRTTIAAPYKIPTGSMIPTLLIGDHIFVSKLTYALKMPFTNINLVVWDKPKRGDVIVFKYPEDPSKDYIKRVVGLPGDTIEVRAGQVYLNEKAILRDPMPESELLRAYDEAKRDPEGYALYREALGEVSHYILHHRDFFYNALNDRPPVVIPAQSYFVMGDNRDNSRDSREWGFVPFKAIRGRALVVFFSIKGEPWWVRFERFGNVIR